MQSSMFVVIEFGHHYIAILWEPCDAPNYFGGGGLTNADRTQVQTRTTRVILINSLLTPFRHMNQQRN